MINNQNTGRKIRVTTATLAANDNKDVINQIDYLGEKAKFESARIECGELADKDIAEAPINFDNESEDMLRYFGSGKIILFKKDPLTKNIRKQFNVLLELIDALPESEQENTNLVLAHHFNEKDTIVNANIASEPPSLPKPDLSGKSYDIFPGVRIVEPYLWLKDHWGSWLKHFNKDLPYDFLFQNELGLRDPKLLKALKNQSVNIKSKYGLTTSEIIPSITKRVDIDIQNSNKTELLKAKRIYNAIQNRIK